MGTQADVADAIRYVIGADYVSGTVLPADGGFTVTQALALTDDVVTGAGEFTVAR